MVDGKKAESDIERRYRQAFDNTNDIHDFNKFMSNNRTRATFTLRAPPSCSYDIYDLMRATAASEEQFNASRIPTTGDTTVSETGLSPAISDDPFTTLYRLNDEGSVTVLSIGNLYVNDPKIKGYCDIPIWAFPQESSSNHGACTLGKNEYSIYSQLSKKYLNRYAKIWLAIWPGNESNYEFNGKKYQVLGPYDRFLLQAVNENRSERYQVAVPTAPDWPEIVYFFGRNPVVISLQFLLFNTLTHNWTEQFLQLYDTTFRGTKLVEHKTSIYIGFEDVLYCGYLLNLNIGRTAMNSDALPVNMSMLITRRNTLHIPLIYKGRSVLDKDFLKLYPELRQTGNEAITAAATMTANEEQANAAEVTANLKK